MLIREMNQERMEAMLLEDELDVGIAFDDSRSQEIVVQPLLTETLCSGGEPVRIRWQESATCNCWLSTPSR